MTQIWYSHLHRLVELRSQSPSQKGPLSADFPVYEESLDEAQEAEAIQVLNAIFDMREHQASNKPDSIARVAHALAMLYFILHDIEKVIKKTICFWYYHAYIFLDHA